MYATYRLIDYSYLAMPVRLLVLFSLFSDMVALIPHPRVQ